MQLNINQNYKCKNLFIAQVIKLVFEQYRYKHNKRNFYIIYYNLTHFL